MATQANATILTRRFGYGPAGDQPRDPAGILDSLSGTDEMARRFPVASLDEAMELGLARRRAIGKSQSQKAKDDPVLQAAEAALDKLQFQTLAVSFARILDSRSPFRERLSWFWADHFTVRAKLRADLGLPGAFVDAAIRPNLTGRFADMLKAVVTHPAMILYLDQESSVGPGSRQGKDKGRGLNENLAREILELHTLGAGSGYTQDDVRQFAELLTGLTYSRGNGVAFRPGLAEPGAETVLGRRYGGDRPELEDIFQALEDIAARPETARHLAHKLAVHFVADQPPDDLVAALEAAYAGSDGTLSEVYAALLAHPAALDPVPQKARQPFDFMAAALRALRLDGAAVTRLPRPMLRQCLDRPLVVMSQPLFRAPGPDGWKEEREAWLTPQGLAGRIAWAMGVPERLRPELPDPAGFAEAALGEGADPAVIRAAAVAQTRPEGVGIVLASPGFNLR